MRLLSNIPSKMQNYLKPLKTEFLVDEKDHAAIFSNIESIYQANKFLLTEMQKAGNDVIQLGHVLVKFGPVLKIYIQYVNNFSNSVSVIEKNLKNVAVSEFCTVNKFFSSFTGKITPETSLLPF